MIGGPIDWGFISECVHPQPAFPIQMFGYDGRVRQLRSQLPRQIRKSRVTRGTTLISARSLAERKSRSSVGLRANRILDDLMLSKPHRQSRAIIAHASFLDTITSRRCRFQTSLNRFVIGTSVNRSRIGFAMIIHD